MSKRIFHYLFIIAIAFTSCKKNNDDDDDDDNTTAVTINSLPQISGTLDGASYSFMVGEDYYAGTGIFESTDTSTNVTTAVYRSQILLDTNVVFDISKGSLMYVDSSTQTAFSNLFAVGNYSYSVDAKNGVEVSLWDDNGLKWSTSLGDTVQTNGTFKIDDMRTEILEGKFRAKIKASFNCTLYDDNGNSKNITDGVYVGYFTKFH